jgi:hypothetical protein
VPLQFLQAAGAGSQIWCVVCVFSGLLCSVLTFMSGICRICIVCCFCWLLSFSFSKEKNELETSKLLTNRKDPKKKSKQKKKKKKTMKAKVLELC